MNRPAYAGLFELLLLIGVNINGQISLVRYSVAKINSKLPRELRLERRLFYFNTMIGIRQY